MFTGNWILSRFILRRDITRTLVWFSVILGLAVGFGASITQMYPDQASLDDMVEPLGSPAFKAMLGNFYLDDGVLTLGGMYSVYMSVWLIMIVGGMSVALVVRHTRQDEERGRLEVIRSLPVGRLANLSSALTVAVILNLLLALLIGVGLGAVGSATGRGMDVAGAFTIGAACAAFGIVMAGVTAVFCQLNKFPSTAMACSFGTIAALYLVFMMGATQKNSIIFNASLLGYLQSSQFFVANHWLPIIVTTVIALVICAVSLWLCGIRDLGESLVPTRTGQRDAAASLRSPGRLAWRLLRGWVVFWAVLIFVLGFAYGSVMNGLDSFIESNEVFRQMSQGNVMVMASMFLLIGTVIGALPMVQFILKIRSEEKAGHAEHIVARAASRDSQMRGYFLIGLASAVLVPLLNGVGFWAGSASVMTTPIPLSGVLTASAVYIPALLVLLGLAVALIGWLPRFTALAWGYLGYSFIALYLGALAGLPDWMGKLTPFGYVPQLPYVEQLGEAPYTLADGTVLVDATGAPVIMPVFADEATYTLSGGHVTALVVMTVLAVALAIIGFVGYRKRDMTFA